MLEQWFAGLGLVACIAIGAWLVLGPARRQRWQQAVLQGWRWRRTRRQARQVAAQAIERARTRPVVDRQGNVYRPESFNGRPPDDKLH